MRLARLAALALSTLAALALVEVGTRWFVPVRELGPAFSLYDPILGARHKPNQRTTRWTPEFTMQLSTNSSGQRGPEPTPDDRSAAARILFVGDSFTEGYGVDDGQEYPRLVATRLAGLGIRAQIINEGVGNTGTGRAYRLVRAYASEPDRQTILVYQFSANDFGDDQRDGFFSLAGDGRLAEAPVPVPLVFLRRIQPVVDAIPGLSRSHFFAALMQIARARRQPERAASAPTEEGAIPASDGEREQLTLRLIAEIIAAATSRGWQVVILVADASPDVASRIEEVARSGSAAFVRVPDKSERPDLYYRVDGHWNPAGHAEAAARLRTPLEGWLPRLASR